MITYEIMVASDDSPAHIGRSGLAKSRNLWSRSRPQRGELLQVYADRLVLFHRFYLFIGQTAFSLLAIMRLTWG